MQYRHFSFIFCCLIVWIISARNSAGEEGVEKRPSQSIALPEPTKDGEMQPQALSQIVDTNHPRNSDDSSSSLSRQQCPNGKVSLQPIDIPGSHDCGEYATNSQPCRRLMEFYGFIRDHLPISDDLQGIYRCLRTLNQTGLVQDFRKMKILQCRFVLNDSDARELSDIQDFDVHPPRYTPLHPCLDTAECRLLSRRPRTKRSGEGLIEGIESHQIQRGPVHADVGQRQSARAVYYTICVLVVLGSIGVGIAIVIRKCRNRTQRSKSKRGRRPTRNILSHWGVQPTISLPWRRERFQAIPDPVKRHQAAPEQIWRDEPYNSADGSVQFEQRFRELGLLAKSSRKRLKDLFDIESLGSFKERQRKLRGNEDRVPVMPPAPNASVRVASQHAKSTRSYAMLRKASMQRARRLQSKSEVARPAYLEDIQIAMGQHYNRLG